MASWEQQITEELQEVVDAPVRFDIAQSNSESRKATARNNIDISSSASNLSGNDYMIILSY